MHNTILSAAGALIRDEQGRILLLEPTYKDHWEIPGGIIEVGETPSQGCARELTEELGLVREPGALLVVDWAPHPAQGDRVLFVFDGGILTVDEIAAIRLQPEELKSAAFLPPDEAFGRLIPRLERRMRAAVRAQEERRTVYLEHGVAHGG
ncbi:NUDIX domain-containing protein [Actinophytocola algeriensis]|uniref:ADP-ribose pyrophosphatase YjhB (NUDIX family) n=1 Tax=Actinophytocola algeriensis TaxID=1768010 RepID=A0A7W7VC39_9PSEU|nr:NUDIX hydrolase [Actinophytocola algeriensis]MBB4904666.1 ADP-ribose pyrophosphatase YjhB (NUDIX family) [Actinophytocola algeriensis]MBE1476475.1 ADP-ribose pyrophosphatase YjhB (NUDIX family) [Actinophytocola algeriensis]